MFLHYLKASLRFLSRHKGYTFINVLGLTVSIACCVLVMQFVKSEWSFDRFHSKSDRIYRAWLQEHYEGEVFTNTMTPIPLVPLLQAGLPEVEASCRVASMNTLVKHKETSFDEPVNMVDSNFFELFDFPLVSGNQKQPFSGTHSVILTEDAAKKYFGRETAVGKSLMIQLGSTQVPFTISGVMRNIPLESSIRFNMVIPFYHARSIWSENTITSAWSNVVLESYFLLRKGVSVEKVNQRIPSLTQPHVAKNYKPGAYTVTLQPLTDIHLNDKLPAGNQPVSNPKYSYILATVGILILLIACINFVTLSVARSTTRALEVGVRKVMGAEKGQLVKQYWGEALILTLVAVLAGVALALLLQQPFNSLANRQLSLRFDGFTVVFIFLLIAVIALVAGIYPAFVLSSFQPIQVLKGRLRVGNRMGFFRRALMVGQFAASIILIIGTVTISRQLDYLRTKDLGYNRDYVVVVPTNKSIREGFALGRKLKTEIEKNPAIRHSSLSIYSMAEYGWMNLGYKDNKDVFRQFKFNAVDAEFVPTMGLQIVQGRSFSGENPADSNYILVNEALVKEYGWKDPIGQKLPGEYEHRILGVVRDFHIVSLHEPIGPVVMAIKPDSIFSRSSDISMEYSPKPRLSIRFQSGSPQENIDFLRKTWKSVSGDQDFEYSFLDDALATAYQQEERLGRIVRYASGFSIFIACMGLFGLSAFSITQRVKEIGIRKVLGARIVSIVALLSKDFLLLVGIAALIAFPLAWFALNEWLTDFAYRIHVSWLVFIAAGLSSLIIALATVGFQAVRAALSNPVKSLRTE